MALQKCLVCSTLHNSMRCTSCYSETYTEFLNGRSSTLHEFFMFSYEEMHRFVDYHENKARRGNEILLEYEKMIRILNLPK